MTTPRLTSIVMVTFHTGRALEESIASVLAQTADVELILVNNGNPLGVESTLISRFRDEPLVRLLTGHGNIGFARACNLGARMAQGDRLLFLAPDSVLPPDALAHLIWQEEHVKRPFMIGVRQLDENGHDLRGSRRAILTPLSAFLEFFTPQRFFSQKRLNRHAAPMPRGLSSAPALSRAFIYMSKEDFLPQGFDEGFFLDGADYDFCLHFRLRGGKIYFDPDCYVTRLATQTALGAFSREVLAAMGLSRYFHKNFRRSVLSYPLLWLLDIGLGFRAIVRATRRALNRR